MRVGTPQGRWRYGRALASPVVMVAFVLRLRSESLARGAVVGELEDVDTGARHLLRSADELLTLLAVPRAGSDEVVVADVIELPNVRVRPPP
jgi:hypothetical protein